MADRYWVNRSGGTGSMGTGSGYWNDTNNWSATSGGNGGAGVPTSSDNVFFDNTSAGNCTLDMTPTIINLTISSGYSGSTLYLGLYTVTCTGNISIASNDNLLDAGTSTVVRGGTSVGTLINPSLSNAFYNLRISYETNMLGDVHAHGGTVTIDSDVRLNMHPGVGVYGDLYVRGHGTVLALNGYVSGDHPSDGNAGDVILEEDDDDTIINVPAGNGWHVNGSFSATGLILRQIGSINTTYSFSGDIDNIDHLLIEGPDGGTITVNTNNYNITTYAFIVFGTINTGDATITANFGSSELYGGVFIRFMSDGGAIYNLQSAKFFFGWWSVYNSDTDSVDVNPTFNVGTSTVTITDGIGEFWQTDQDVTKFYNLVWDPSDSEVTSYVSFSVSNTCTLTSGKSYNINGNLSIENLSCQATEGNVSVVFNPEKRHDFGTMELTGPNTIELKSSTPGDAWSGRVTGYSVVDHVAVSDSHLDGGTIDALDTSNKDLGNNGDSWLFDDFQQSVTIH